MKKTKIQRLTALLLCLIFVASCFSVNTFAADGAADNGVNDEAAADRIDDSALIFDPQEMLEILDTISYNKYLADNDDAKMAEETIVIDAINDVVPEKTEFDTVANVGKYGGVDALLTPGTGDATWRVNVPKTARYNIKIVYYAPDDGKATSIERIFKINGNYE